MPPSRETPAISRQVAANSATSARMKMKSTRCPATFRRPRYRGGCEGGVKKRGGTVTAALLPALAFKRDGDDASKRLGHHHHAPRGRGPLRPDDPPVARGAPCLPPPPPRAGPKISRPARRAPAGRP